MALARGRALWRRTGPSGRSREEEEKRINKERAHIQAKFKGAIATDRTPPACAPRR